LKDKDKKKLGGGAEKRGACFFFEPEAHDVAQSGLEFAVFLPQPPKCWITGMPYHPLPQKGIIESCKRVVTHCIQVILKKSQTDFSPETMEARWQWNDKPKC
jgi:hypothetical protein